MDYNLPTSVLTTTSLALVLLPSIEQYSAFEK